MKKRIFLVVILVLTVLCVGCFASCKETIKYKDFKKNGMTITLPDYFEAANYIGYSACWATDDAFVVGNRISKVEAAKVNIRSLKVYTEDNLTLLNKKDVELHLKTDEEGNEEYYYAYYSATEDKQSYLYMVMTLEGEEHFYLLSFICFMEKYEGKYDTMFGDWAASVKVK